MAEIFKPGYNESHALIIGIDDYETAPKLSYAVSDAEAINDSLIKNFSFKKKNIQLLKNKEATRENISKAYLSYVNENISPDDKILFFFAGHGVTQPGRRGETGYLVPYEGQRALLSTLIRWDEFTRNADLIPAKHILYIMDACYGGLAVTRSLQAGSVRFLKDMTTRFTRQVITAGKANQVVADAGGPVPNHSVFTGHLLQALDGRGADTEGNITANGIMAYVVDIARTEVFKQLPEHARHYVPMSEYMFKLLQPNLDDLLFLGKDYEIYYDKFELFMSLVHADLADRKGKRLWGPIGRFGWKRDREDDPYEKLVEEIKDKNDNWDPIQAGLFQEMAGFKTLLQKYNEELLSKINWW